jgi:hypothetical protein
MLWTRAMTTHQTFSIALCLSLCPLACGAKHDASTSAPATSSSAVSAAVSPAGPTPFEVSAAALRPGGLVSPASFQGEIVVAVKADASRKLPTTIIYEDRGERVRYTPAASQLAAVADLGTNLLYAIDDSSKTYEVIDMAAPTSAKPTASAKIQKTGKTERVANFDCEDWTINDGVEQVDVCAWNGAAYVDLASDAKPGRSETSWAAALTAERMFPLRVVVHDEAGKEVYRAEATKVTPTVISETAFVVPTTYHKADLGGEMRMASLP